MSNHEKKMSGVGSLVIVGSGIQSTRDMTRGALGYIQQADKVLYLATERITTTWLERLNPSAEPLHRFYSQDKPRKTTYREMVEHILSFVRSGLSVCVVCYGHPGVFADPMHESMRIARRENHQAQMLPGISSIDWLYADLRLDPAQGCQIYEATDFLTHEPRFDTRRGLILLQIGIIGEKGYPAQCNVKGFCRLAKSLSDEYGANHEVVIYEASQISIAKPRIQRMPLKLAATVNLSLAATMYVPPRGTPAYSGNE